MRRHGGRYRGTSVVDLHGDHVGGEPDGGECKLRHRGRTATAGTDYDGLDGVLTFAPGETAETITVSVLGDRLIEPNKTFFVDLSTSANDKVTIVDSRGQGTIIDDDSDIAPALAWNTADSGVDINYQISGADLSQAPTIAGTGSAGPALWAGRSTARPSRRRRAPTGRFTCPARRWV